MGNQTKIAWTDATWNPWRGCRKVSAGCKNCYMFRDQKRYGANPELIVRSKTTFRQPLLWKTSRKVFTCSWSDFFIDAADAWRAAAWDIIKRTPQHTYQILTKRPQNIATRLPQDWDDGYKNVWLGVTAEIDATAEERISILLNTPAALRFVSCEPLLGEIQLTKYWRDHQFGGCWETLIDGLDWVIAGGESGPDFRPMKLDWARSLRDQCIAADVAFFYKQESGTRPGANPLLDGVEWKQFPRTS